MAIAIAARFAAFRTLSILRIGAPQALRFALEMIGNDNVERQGPGALEFSMADIKHVVVLMLENRSFDALLGRLYANRADFDGL